MEDAVAEPLDRVGGIVALRAEPAGVDRRTHPLAEVSNPRKDLFWRPLRVVLEAEPQVMPLE